MDNTLRKALWEILRPLLQLITNLLNPESGEEWLKEFKKFLRKEQTWVSRAVLSLTTLIEACKLDWVDSNITEARFPMPEGFTLGAEPKLYHFNPSISSEKVIEEMAKDGFRPATIFDLLDYGAKNPELQRRFPIVALGSVTPVDDDRRVACLSGGDARRGLGLYWFGRGWGGSVRFLAVRN